MTDAEKREKLIVELAQLAVQDLPCSDRQRLFISLTLRSGIREIIRTVCRTVILSKKENTCSPQ